MGLLNLLQQGQTTLSAGSFPGDTPINDAQSGFIQDNSSNNTYTDETLGQPNNGSVLINTLDNTGLDNTIALSNTGTPPPPINTNYPQLSKGEYGGASSQFEPQYNANNTYLSIVDTISIPANNSQVYSLDNTGLDNLNPSFDPTTFKPNSISSPTDYGNVPSSPSVKLGEYGGAPSQYNDAYTPNNTYLNQINTPEFTGTQVSAVTGSGLDTNLVDSSETTFTVPIPDTITVYPAGNVTHNTLSSGTNSSPKPFNQIWNSNNDYYEFMKENWEGH